MPEHTDTPAARQPTVREQAVIAVVLRAMRGVRYGYVQLVIQDGRVVQIDALEKRRLDYD
jgi:hypothetical protein